jgi:hypothetical protein
VALAEVVVELAQRCYQVLLHAIVMALEVLGVAAAGELAQCACLVMRRFLEALAEGLVVLWMHLSLYSVDPDTC